MTPRQKVRIAKQIARMKVDVIEAGFPFSNPDDFSAVQMISRQVRGPIICAFARAKKADIDSAAESIRAAERKRIHTFIPTSARHMRVKGFVPEAVAEQAGEAVAYARRFTDDVEFTPEDASRSDMDFVCRVIDAAIRAGAGTINIADTVGIMMPWQFGGFIRTIRERVTGADRVVWSAHCHNDIGMAVANSVAAIQAGARQVECTVNGIGERAGNAAIEEVVMAIRVHSKEFGCDSGVVSEEIGRTSRMVARTIRQPIPRNKAIVGANAFSHEAGVHQDGVMKDPETYEIMTPESVGWVGKRFVTGKHSGRKVIAAHIAAIGVPEAVRDRVVTVVMERVKAGSCPTDREIMHIAGTCQ